MDFNLFILHYEYKLFLNKTTIESTVTYMVMDKEPNNPAEKFDKHIEFEFEKAFYENWEYLKNI